MAMVRTAEVVLANLTLLQSVPEEIVQENVSVKCSNLMNYCY
jgi:hypothetical protein